MRIQDKHVGYDLYKFEKKLLQILSRHPPALNISVIFTLTIRHYIENNLSYIAHYVYFDAMLR